MGRLWSGRPNWGNTTGTPPRIGCVPSNTAPSRVRVRVRVGLGLGLRPIEHRIEHRIEQRTGRDEDHLLALGRAVRGEGGAPQIDRRGSAASVDQLDGVQATSAFAARGRHPWAQDPAAW
eukprot:scaffold23464_cov43-Phaeocystis_antarctica.AAC.2